MKILLLGKNGQVGWELQRSLATLGEVVACGREQADLNNGEKLRDLVRELAPQIVVNAAAYTAVDKAETDIVKAYQVNAEAVAVLAEECKKINAWLFIILLTMYSTAAKADFILKTMWQIRYRFMAKVNCKGSRPYNRAAVNI